MAGVGWVVQPVGDPREVRALLMAFIAATCDCGECPKCRHRAYTREWRLRNPESSRASNRRYYEKVGSTPAHERDRVKRKAQHLVYTEVRAGRMKPQPCETCGAKAEAHHDDYDKPFEVRWLCRRHHMQEHLP